jgi:cation transport regulator ChaC
MVRYFAYGSNLSPQEMRRVTGSARFYAVARLPDHILGFTRFSDKRGCGVADIVPSRGNEVWGVVYELPESALHDLDEKEGVRRRAYQRTRVQVEAEGGMAEEALTYAVVNKEGPFTPSADYMRLLVVGARHWGLPGSYQHFLESIATDV